MPGWTARALAERLRIALEAQAVGTAVGPVPMTTSIGVADAKPGLACLLGRADAALYRAKASGRNRVVCDLAAMSVKDA